MCGKLHPHISPYTSPIATKPRVQTSTDKPPLTYIKLLTLSHHPFPIIPPQTQKIPQIISCAGRLNPSISPLSKVINSKLKVRTSTQICSLASIRASSPSLHPFSINYPQTQIFFTNYMCWEQTTPYLSTEQAYCSQTKGATNDG